MDRTGARRLPGTLGWGATPGVRDLDGLSLRTMHYHALANFGLLTKAAIVEMSERDLLRFPRLGPSAIATIKRELARHGLALRSDLANSRERLPISRRARSRSGG
jgi:DNA-directed RNA polymerase alpha subunit